MSKFTKVLTMLVIVVFVMSSLTITANCAASKSVSDSSKNTKGDYIKILKVSTSSKVIEDKAAEYTVKVEYKLASSATAQLQIGFNNGHDPMGFVMDPKAVKTIKKGTGEYTFKATAKAKNWGKSGKFMIIAAIRQLSAGKASNMLVSITKDIAVTASTAKVSTSDLVPLLIKVKNISSYYYEDKMDEDTYKVWVKGNKVKIEHSYTQNGMPIEIQYYDLAKKECINHEYLSYTTEDDFMRSNAYKSSDYYWPISIEEGPGRLYYEYNRIPQEAKDLYYESYYEKKGAETVNGFKCNIYQSIDSETGKKEYLDKYYISIDTGLVIKMEDEKGNEVASFKNLQVGKVTDEMVNVPAGIKVWANEEEFENAKPKAEGATY